MYNFPIAYLNSNDGSGILAFGDGDTILLDGPKVLDKLQQFIDEHKGQHLVGYISYDVKNELEELVSENEDRLQFPLIYFWSPKYVVRMKNENFEFVQGAKTEESFDFLNYFLEEETDQNFHEYVFPFKPKTKKEEYIHSVNKLKDHIQQGDIYEVNFCQEFHAEGVEIDYPLDAYFKLNLITRAPFSTFLTFNDYSIFCGSPERYLNRTGNRLKSQPIKGTSKRGATTEDDELLKTTLQNDPKERAENVMIVDLVRNDLSKIAKDDTVKVDELFGVQTFETVHQLVSTISCDIDESTKFTDILKATFPMGSMTGAPKVRAMQLIEENENFKRGLYSGTIGYMSPNGNFDFNVVIRTLLYNRSKKYLSCSVGGAITINSDAEKEYEECLVKVQRILEGMNQ